MATASRIEWTEQTWNPTTGCTKVSPGCKNCYAKSMATRLQAMGVAGYDNGFRLSLVPERIKQPLLRHKPTVYFVNSMSDLFHEKIPDSYLARVFSVIRDTPQHTYQILTKRPTRMQRYFEGQAVPDNVWLGVSVENRRHGIPRIDCLRNVNATVRFISAEPLLEDLCDINLADIHWMIVGGESGAKARPMKNEWVAHIQKQCLDSGTAFFFKQWGAWGADGIRRAKHINGRMFHGRTWDEMPALAIERISQQ